MPWLLTQRAAIVRELHALNVLGKGHCIVELGAGSGYWASQLTREGADVIAFDRDPPKGLEDGLDNFFFHRQFFPVTKGTPEVLRDASRVSHERALLLVWPFQSELHNAEKFAHDDRVEPWDADALTNFQGEIILHVGHLEPKGDRLVNTSRRFTRLLRERFDLQLTLTATVGACANGPEEVEALTVWRRKQEPAEPLQVSASLSAASLY